MWERSQSPPLDPFTVSVANQVPRPARTLGDAVATSGDDDANARKGSLVRGATSLDASPYTSIRGVRQAPETSDDAACPHESPAPLTPCRGRGRPIQGAFPIAPAA
ncbi:hypothetical protein Acy02nite_68010 [Actinoplanes cyaneus]|uniref:Uncharacterized protein n=1 Tax=Actinoplanes cyaneus TaxID=52696 RepID=A0A919IVP6_9ACTN|nr:hypothetical protein Acy02nite_68010 [Actinoplanes cyaneus]